MLFNTLKRVFINGSALNIDRNNIIITRCIASNWINRKQPQQDEVEEDVRIDSLFENSVLQHKPALTKEVLRSYRNPSKQKYSKTPSKSNFTQVIQTTKIQKTVQKTTPQLINDAELGLEFVRLTLQDPLLSTLLTTVRSRKRRDRNREIVVEGRRLIKEALDCELQLHTIFFSQKEQLALLKDELAVAQRVHNSKIYKVPQHDLKTWSSLTTPPGLLAIFERPSSNKSMMSKLLDNESVLPITVVCDNIREPNNLGSIIRTCAALPCQQIIVTRGCCDPWESKALRGGCGGQFRTNILDDVDWENLPLIIPPEFADDCFVFIAENNIDKIGDKKRTVDYADLQQTGVHNIVIIGGESHGVSEDAYRFLDMVGNRGKYVYIPLAAGMDSLNVTSALTLILFELRRNLQKKLT